VEVNFTMPKLVSKTVLYETEAALAEVYAQNSVRLFPHYPAELFSVSYMDEVIREARRVGSVVGGFFDRYEATVEEGRILISIPFLSGGIALLDLAKTGQILSGIIRSEFSLSYEVQIVQSADSAQCFSDYESAQRAWLEKEAAEIPRREAMYRAARAAEAEAASAPAEADKPSLPRVASLFDGAETVEYLPDNIVRAGRMEFDISEAELLAGAAFDLTELTPLRGIRTNMRQVSVLGTVFGVTTKELKNGEKLSVNIGITDHDASIFIKTVIAAEVQDELFGIFKNGAALAIRGSVKTDKFDGELYLSYTDVQKIKQIKRQDHAEKKRIELHLHTCQSAMDAITKPDEVVETAHRWGHDAVAITDHGNLQAYPIAMLKAEKLGMKVLLLTPCLINKTGEDLSRYPQGGFPELMNYIRSL